MKTDTCFGSLKCLVDRLNCGIQMIQEENISGPCFPQFSRPESKLPQSLFPKTERAFCYQRTTWSLATVALRHHKSVNHTGFWLPHSISADILHSLAGVLSRLTLKHAIALTSRCFLRMYFHILGFHAWKHIGWKPLPQISKDYLQANNFLLDSLTSAQSKYEYFVLKLFPTRRIPSCM